MTEQQRKNDEGVEGKIRSTRLPKGGVRVALVTRSAVSHVDLNTEAARSHAMGVLALCEPLTETGAAALAVEQAKERDHG